jgi:hypothetical protein
MHEINNSLEYSDLHLEYYCMQYLCPLKIAYYQLHQQWKNPITGAKLEFENNKKL